MTTHTEDFELKYLEASDFTGDVRLQFDDGSEWYFTSGFARKEKKEWAVYTEHNGYYRVPEHIVVELTGDVR